MRTVGIIDYGLGNLTSVAGAVRKLGHDAVVAADPAVLRRTDCLSLPGVGAFGDGMRFLRERNLVEPLSELVLDKRKPIFGICLGSQLLGRQSEEFGLHDGLGWVDVTVHRLPLIDAAGDMLRVPHVGWNDLEQTQQSELFHDIPGDSVFYYVHSYFLQVTESGLVTGECNYGKRFASTYERGNIYAAQFHPEKSQLAGLTMLRNFIERT